MSKPFSIGLALLFVGLQIASLSHGATYGFAAHSHANNTIIAFDTPVLDLFGYHAPDDQKERAPDRFCDLHFYCDKLDKLAGGAPAGANEVQFDAGLLSENKSPLFGTVWQKAVARGPPSIL